MGRIRTIVHALLWFLLGFALAALWLTCSAEPESVAFCDTLGDPLVRAACRGEYTPPIRRGSAYALDGYADALDSGIEHDADRWVR